MTDETKQDNRDDQDTRARLLHTAIQAVKETQAAYDARIKNLDNVEAENYKTWLRESALKLMTSEAIPMADLGPIDWAGVSVKTADAIWQETLHRARLNEVGE